MDSKLIPCLIMIVFLLPFSSQAQEHNTSSQDTQAKLAELISGDHRSEGHKNRDQYRHPFETLTFFGI